MIAVAAPRAERCVQTTDFINAIGNRITHTGDEIAGDDGEIGAEIVGHIHGAAHLGAGHVAAQVNIADLDDLHSVERSRQIGNGNLDTADLIVQAFGSKTVHSAEKWSGSGSGRGGAEKVPAAGVSNGLDKGGDGRDVCRGWWCRG